MPTPTVFRSFLVDTVSALGDRSGGEGLLVARSGTHMRAYACRHRAFLLRSLARDVDPRAGVVSRETQRRSSMHEHRPTTLGSSSHSCWRPARPCCHAPLLPRSGSTVAVTRTWTATCPGRAWTAAARAEIAVLVTILLRHPSRIILAMPISSCDVSRETSPPTEGLDAGIAVSRATSQGRRIIFTLCPDDHPRSAARTKTDHTIFSRSLRVPRS